MISEFQIRLLRRHVTSAYWPCYSDGWLGGEPEAVTVQQWLPYSSHPFSLFLPEAGFSMGSLNTAITLKLILCPFVVLCLMPVTIKSLGRLAHVMMVYSG